MAIDVCKCLHPLLTLLGTRCNYVCLCCNFQLKVLLYLSLIVCRGSERESYRLNYRNYNFDSEWKLKCNRLNFYYCKQ